jgi:hypothetical protein
MPNGNESCPKRPGTRSGKRSPCSLSSDPFAFGIFSRRILPILPKSRASASPFNSNTFASIAGFCTNSSTCSTPCYSQWASHTSQISIKHGFRHPAYNHQIGGASKSRHQFGEAIDLLVGDVNGDGRADEDDKAPAPQNARPKNHWKRGRRRQIPRLARDSHGRQRLPCTLG